MQLKVSAPSCMFDVVKICWRKAAHRIKHLSMTIFIQMYDDVFEQIYDRLDWALGDWTGNWIYPT